MNRLLLLLLSLSILAGCPKHPETVTVHQGTAIFDPADPGKQVLFDVPVEVKTFDPPNGWERSDVIMVVVPPSLTPTKVNLRKKKKTLMEKILPGKNDTDFEVVSDNSEIRPIEAPETPWWWYAISIGGALIILWEVLSGVFTSIAGPIKLILKLFGR